MATINQNPIIHHPSPIIYIYIYIYVCVYIYMYKHSICIPLLHQPKYSKNRSSVKKKNHIILPRDLQTWKSSKIHLYHALPGSFAGSFALVPWCVHRIRRLRGFGDGLVVQRGAKGPWRRQKGDLWAEALPSGELTWQWKMAIYSGFSH